MKKSLNFIITFIIFIICTIFIGKSNISFNPVSVEISDWNSVYIFWATSFVGIVFIILSYGEKD